MVILKLKTMDLKKVLPYFFFESIDEKLTKITFFFFHRAYAKIKGTLAELSSRNSTIKFAWMNSMISLSGVAKWKWVNLRLGHFFTKMQDSLAEMIELEDRV